MRARLVTRGARRRWAAVLGTGAIALGLAVAMPGLAVSATPGFVQQANTHAPNVSTLSVTMNSATAVGDRLVVEVGVWRDTLATGAGFTGRANVSPNGDIEFLVEDTVVGQGAQPAATVKTGAQTGWLMATMVLKHS